MIYINLLIITVIIVLLFDFTDINMTFKKIIAYILKIKNPEAIKVNLCTLCITWWSCLSYIIFTGQFCMLALLAAAVFAVFTIEIHEIILTIKDILGACMRFLQKLTYKIK